MQNENIVDREKLVQFMENMECNKELYNSLLGHLDAYFKELEAVEPQNDAETLTKMGHLAHKLKSSCDSFGSTKLKDLFYAMEKAGRNQDFTTMKQNFETVFSIRQKFFDELRQFEAEYF